MKNKIALVLVGAVLSCTVFAKETVKTVKDGLKKLSMLTQKRKLKMSQSAMLRLQTLSLKKPNRKVINLPMIKTKWMITL